jgi:cytoskeleton protein RodZ
MTWAVLLMLATLLFIWWQNRVELEQPVPQSQETQLESGFEEPVLEQVVTRLESVQEGVSESESASLMVVEDSEQVLNEIDKLLSTSDHMLPSEDDNSEQPVEVVESEQEVNPAAFAEPAAAEPAPAVALKQVVFLFKDACWTEVRDSEGKLRIFGELSSGRQRILDSKLGPFSVLLGNAPEVELTIDGEVFDLKPYTRGRVARFTLDPNRL